MSVIKANLPHNFLLNLGAYVQTCAHIELQVAVMICELDRVSGNTTAAKLSFPVIRKKPVGALLEELAHCIDRSAQALVSISEELKGLLRTLEDGAKVRHKAVHGAFFFASASDDALSVNFFNKENGLHSLEETMLDQGSVEELLASADRVYFQLTNLIARLRTIQQS